jgi:D-amino peptidase
MRGEQLWRKPYGSENIVGAIMVGYPGMAGSSGFLSHTLDNKVFEYIKVNGREYGAIGLTAALLGEFNIPLVAVVGDEAAVNEAQRINSLITGVIVKKKKGDWIEVLPPDIAHKIIYDKIREAIDKLPSITPFKISPPIEIEFIVKNEYYLNRLKSLKKNKVENKIVIITSSSYIQAYQTL